MIKNSKSLSSQVSVYFLGNVVSTLIGFLVPVILVRVFSKGDYGEYAQLLLIYIFLFKILQFGLRQSLYYLLPRHKEKKVYYITNTLIFCFIIGILNLLFLTIFKENIARLFNDFELSSLLPFCGLHILFMLISCPFEPILIIESKAEKASLIVFVSEVLRGIFVITFVLIFETVFSAIIGLTCYSLIRFISYLIFAHRYFGIRFDGENIKYLKQQILYATPLGLSGFMGNISKMLDKFVLGVFFSTEVFAIYTVGNFRIPFVGMLFTTAGDVVLPRAVELLKINNVKQFLKLWEKLITKFSFIGIGVFFFMQLIAHDLITLVYTSQYESSVPIFRIVLLVIFGPMMRYGFVLKALGYTKDILKSNIIAFIFSIPFTFIMVKYIGLIGAAISMVTIYYINAISQLCFSTKRLGKKFTNIYPVSIMLKMGIFSAILFVLLFTLQDFIQLKILRLLMSGSVFIIGYTFICYRTNTFNLFGEELFRNLFYRFKLVKRYFV